ncbi:MAG: ribonuclease T [Gammaproteobacteria bacterium]|nr:ribonuclease T [Gammaproteobacteria bacterium]
MSQNEATAPVAEEQTPPSPIAARFRGFLPVIVDVETGGFNPATDALLEIAAVFVHQDDAGDLRLGDKSRYLVKPFPGANLEPASLQVTGIDPYHPLRPALDEADALRRLFQEVRKAVKDAQCNRAILVGHNAFFDLQFLNAAVTRSGVKRNPFHPFSSFDTATLGGVAYGQTVLGRAVTAAGFDWDGDNAHSALYDAEKTAELFCAIVNRFRPFFESAAGAAPPAPADGGNG